MKKPIYTFFLPQFHECEFNNLWWGKRFTEWENVRTAQKLYVNHNQPRIPLNGYFDLSNISELKNQIEESKNAGIDGLIIYHYWSNGQRPLGKILDLILANKQLDLKFALSWANHSWTRSWRNRRGSLDTIFKQVYEDDNTLHFEFLSKCFLDERYITVDNKKLFIIYDWESIPNIKIFLENLRDYFKEKHSTDLYVLATVKSWTKNKSDLSYFDGCIISQPGNAFHSPENIFTTNDIEVSTLTKLKNKSNLLKWILYLIQDLFFNKPRFFDYNLIVDRVISQTKRTTSPSHKIDIFHSAFVDWDNTPRYGKRATVIKNFSLIKFEQQLQHIYDSQGIIFIYAWNEWGEGMYLQSDTKYLNRKLEIVKKISQS